MTRSSTCVSLTLVLVATLRTGFARGDEPAPSVGLELFERVWTPGDSRSDAGDGLGPLFNARSCLDCHRLGGTGGAGGFERNVDVISAVPTFNRMNTGFASYSYSFRMGVNGFESSFGNVATPARAIRLDPVALAAIHPGLRTGKSVMLHAVGTRADYRSWREKIPGIHGDITVVVTPRNPTPLFGMGLIDAIPDSAIEAAARRRHPGFPQVKGKVRRLADGKIGRFGWKAQSASLDGFVRAAAAVELGLEVPGHHQSDDPGVPQFATAGLDMNEEQAAGLVDFVRRLPAPIGLPPEGNLQGLEFREGKRLFKAVGCATCHLPTLGPIEGLYSDLLLHDMTPRPNTTGTNPYAAFFGGANPPVEPAREPRPQAQNGDEPTPLEWRTPPLWGLKSSGPYWHDGQAVTVDAAIRLHDGQAAESTERYRGLSSRERHRMETFLMSLAAPAPEQNR